MTAVLPRRRGRRHPARSAGVLAAALLLTLSGAALAQDAGTASALGPEAPPDALGAELVPARLRPPQGSMPLRACSFEERLCVHAPAATHPAAVLAALELGARALRVFRVLDLPSPLGDAGLGGSGDYDLYLDPALGHAPLSPGGPLPGTFIDLDSVSGRFDRASAFSILPPPRDAGCEAASTIARAIAHGVIAGIDAAAAPGVISMTASYLASMAAPCHATEAVAVDGFQRSPERELTAGVPSGADGAMLFPLFLDETHGTGRPGHVITALLSVSGQRTPAGSWRWRNEPDVFDALRAGMKDRTRDLGDLLLDFAVARAFVGSRSDDLHLPDVARHGAMGRVRFEWAVPFASLPRRLAPSVPLSSTGSTYLWVDLAGAPPGAELTVLAEWELPVLFRWAVLKIDRHGAEAGRADVPGVFGTTSAQRTVLGLGDLAGLLIVGVNVGDIDRSFPFDPDDAPFEPHSYTVTIAP